MFHIMSGSSRGAGQAPAGKRSGSRIPTLVLAGGWILGLSCVSSAGVALAADAPSPGMPYAVSAFAVPTWDGETLLASSGYYPRYHEPQRTAVVTHQKWHRGPNGWFSIRGGFFDNENVPKNDWLAGMKLTGVLAKGVEIGISTDYQRRSHTSGEVTNEYRDPSGNLVKTTVPTAEVSSSLIPVLGVLELRLPTPGLQPYVGGGAGYEWLVVNGDDFTNNTHFSETFGGFGWQGYAGITLALNEKARLNAEGFWNQSDVSRNVDDPMLGPQVKQQTSVSGGGIRGGLSFGF